MKVHVFWNGWIANDHESFTLGGIQTYLYNLSRICHELGYEFHYYRGSDVDYETCIEGVYTHEMAWKGKPKIGKVFNRYKSLINKEEDIVIFAESSMSVNALDYHSLSIQHGIFWDIPSERKLNIFGFFIKYCRKAYSSWLHFLRFKNVKYMVCVDYNFVNWLRATFPYTITKMRVIPNFSQIAPIAKKPEGVVNIMFARRFEKFRGTRIFGEAISRILDDYNNIEVTVAGWGSDASWLHEKLDKYSNVKFITYDATDSLKIHEDKHIAIVPTTGSEGTSLSMMEAMSSQCAVIISDVGGMTNVVIDKFNGRIVPAGDSEALYIVIKELINNPQERDKIAIQGYKTIESGFSYNKWKQDWIEVLQNIKKL